MSEFDALMVDELRREFRRTRPPAKVLKQEYNAGIFRLTNATSTGFRVFWYPASLLPPICFCLENIRFELIEPLEL